MAPPLPVVFSGGPFGPWRVRRAVAVRGAPLPHASHVASGEVAHPAWRLCGVSGHARYTHRAERELLAAVQSPLGRPEARRAALIPLKKSEAWWELGQDERRAIFEERSGHIAGSLKYLPAIARKLYHCRELLEPFDFLTWFEFAPEHEEAFDELLGALRATEEWRWVEREVDLRLERAE